MERMHEIMKERVEADQAFNLFKATRQNTIDRLNKEMVTAGPIKIGDIVEVTGFSHCGKKMIIDHLWISNAYGKVGVSAEGRILKKDGTPGLRTAYYFIEVGIAP